MWAVLCLSTVSAQPTLRLKTRQQAAAFFRPPALIEQDRTLTRGRHHQLVQFPKAPSGADLARLSASEARIVSYVPDHAFVVSVPRNWSGDGLGLILSEVLRPEDKWSPLINATNAHFVVEFHDDVDPADGRMIAVREGLRILERPDLRPNHLLVEGAPARVRELASWDEVAYVFPAAPDLAAGLPVQSCSGGFSEAGPIGQVIGLVGDGWDGPGTNAADLTYALRNTPSSLGEAQGRVEILRALAEWARYVKIDFSDGAGKGDRKQIEIRFTTRDHGDPYPFDGPGRVLAHTFYPAPPNPEPLAGDMHFDDDEIWRTGADIDLYSVALHELGHALGLGHSDSSNDVMYAYYRRATTLAAGDIAAIRQLYATREATGSAPGPDLPPAPPPPPDPPKPDPPAPAPPPNPPVQPPSGPDRVAPSIRVASPSATSVLVTAPSITVRGTAADNVGVARVTWSSSTAGSGVAAGTVDWTAEIPLVTGINHITVRAIDAAGNTAWRSVVVTRR